MKKGRSEIRRYKTLSQAWWTQVSSFLRKLLYGEMGALYGAIVAIFLLGGCKTIQYVPIKGDTEVVYKDSVITRLDTLYLYRKEIERVRDFTGLLDTLRLETKGARATAYIDTSTSPALLKGTLEDKNVPMEVVVPTKEEYHLKDSSTHQQIPIPTVITEVKEVKYVPWIYKLLSSIGLITLVTVMISLGIKVYKLKGTGFFNILKNLIKKN